MATASAAPSKSVAPKSAEPKAAAPKSAVHKSSAPKSSAPKPSAPKPAAPQTTSKPAPKAQDAVVLLRADHKKVSGLLDEYEKATTKAKKKTLVAQICTELSVHAQVEEEIFYPAVKKALNDHELVPEAIVEHATLKELIAQVEGIEPDGEMFDAKIQVLGEYVKHHVKEEQTEMFPKAEATKIDMVELGGRIAARKIELLAQRA